MWQFPKEFDVIVIGGGHAGCEAAQISARMGMATLLLTMNLDTIAKMSCNPSIGGTAKGHIVREIDALGGVMGEIADKTTIHFRMLNASKGPAVRSPRAQIDKDLYHLEMKHLLEKQENLELKQASIEDILTKDGKAIGVSTKEGIKYLGKTIIICSGTFIKGLIHIGDNTYQAGRSGDGVSISLSDSLKKIGLNLDRLKTGTPPRINKNSINFEKLEKQPSDNAGCFSYKKINKKLDHVNCYITYTTDETKNIILKNLKKSALFSGKIQGVGPRYCPSIEDKIHRFSDKERHQIFLEPEGIYTDEYYLNGLSSSMPAEVQLQVIKSIPGLENADITRFAYAIEYDYVTSSQIFASLETKKVNNLFLAGQINGTTGYEEAAAQGLIAGINASLKVLKKEPFILKRYDSYIGVMIDDLITKEILEPYRMFTSRAEHRLLLRQDNADTRLMPIAYKYGCIEKKSFDHVMNKIDIIQKQTKFLKDTFKSIDNKSICLYQYLSRPEVKYADLIEKFPEDIKDFGLDINNQIELEIKYAGYISRQQKDVKKLSQLENIIIPKTFSYERVIGLRNEAKEKLCKYLPFNLSMASRINGVSPADVSILLVAITKHKK
jgi:tRNA uridine 5-carboxymethylaminomethyl modification enzyme